MTVLDVIEGYFGGLPRAGAAQALSRKEIEEFGNLAVDSANAHPTVDTEVSAPVYSGGFLAGWWPDPILSEELKLALLYQPQILVHDPIADYFGLHRANDLPELHPVRGYFANGTPTVSLGGPREWAANLTYAGQSESLDRVRRNVDLMLQNLIALEPLLRSGAVIARSQWPAILDNKQALLTSSRHDVRDDTMIDAAISSAGEGSVGPTRWDHLRGGRITPNGGNHPTDDRWSWQPEFFYLAKCLAFADAAGGIYVPGSDSDLALLQAKLRGFELHPNRIGMAGDSGRALLTEVAKAVMPDFELDLATVVKVRESEEAFEHWRRFLRNLERQSVGLNPAEVRALVDDEMRPVIAEAQRASRSVAGLKAIAREVGVATTISVGTGAAAAALSGGPSAPGVLAGAVGGVLSWIWRAYGAGRIPEDKRRVVAALVGRK